MCDEILELYSGQQKFSLTKYIFDPAGAKITKRKIIKFVKSKVKFIKI